MLRATGDRSNPSARQGRRAAEGNRERDKGSSGSRVTYCACILQIHTHFPLLREAAPSSSLAAVFYAIVLSARLSFFLLSFCCSKNARMGVDRKYNFVAAFFSSFIYIFLFFFVAELSWFPARFGLHNAGSQRKVSGFLDFWRGVAAGPAASKQQAAGRQASGEFRPAPGRCGARFRLENPIWIVTRKSPWKQSLELVNAPLPHLLRPLKGRLLKGACWLLVTGYPLPGLRWVPILPRSRSTASIWQNPLSRGVAYNRLAILEFTVFFSAGTPPASGGGT